MAKTNQPNTDAKAATLVEEERQRLTKLEPLVNENTSTEDLLAIIEKQKGTIGTLTADCLDKKETIKELQSKVGRAAYEPDVRKFRIYLAILQGMAAGGTFDSEKLRKAPGTELPLMKHAVGLAEVAQQATEKRF